MACACFSLPAALVSTGRGFYAENASEARTALAMVRDASDELAILLEGGHTTVPGRLTGAFRNIGCGKLADDILQAIRCAGHKARESNPFDTLVAVRARTDSKAIVTFLFGTKENYLAHNIAIA